MSVLEVVHDGHPALKKDCKSVKRLSEDLRLLISSMRDTMREYNGVGLAANQVGVNYRIIVVSTCEEEPDEEVFINPRIVWRSDDEELSDEGCLSFPDLFATVARNYKVEVAALDCNMKKVRIREEGFRARIFQHEIDHLNGIVFLDRAEKGTLKRFVRKGDDEVEEAVDIQAEEAASNNDAK